MLSLIVSLRICGICGFLTTIINALIISCDCDVLPLILTFIAKNWRVSAKNCWKTGCVSEILYAGMLTTFIQSCDGHQRNNRHHYIAMVPAVCACYLDAASFKVRSCSSTTFGRSKKYRSDYKTRSTGDPRGIDPHSDASTALPCGCHQHPDWYKCTC